MEQTADIALIGLAVMGENLILNMDDHGYTVVAFNRTVSKVDEFLNDAAKGQERHRRALHRGDGRAAQAAAQGDAHGQGGRGRGRLHRELLPHLEPGDIIIDGGNSHFPDTIRRTKDLESKGLLYIGTGVSGGEEGARLGPLDHARRQPDGLAAREGRSSRRSPPRSPTASPAATGWARTAPAITSRWSTTASSTATCSSSARRTS